MSALFFARAYEPLEAYLKPNKALVLYGPRRVGKTTLLQNYLKSTPYKYKLDSGDNLRVQQILSSQDFDQILGYAEGYELIAIDEAQNIPNVGMALKIIVDQIPGIRVFVTGSSSFELSGQVGEPLTGRKTTLTLYPLAQMELLSAYNRFELRESLARFLIFGSYPEVVQAATRQERIEILLEIAHSYLLKDILVFDRIRSARTLLDLLKLLAFQVGSEVSHSELGAQLGVDVKTIQRYLDLLEKTFVLYRLNGFSRNLRQEVTRKAKYYFVDNGIRNALIAQFNDFDQRNDQGALWENFMVMERLKYRQYRSIYGNAYFWRTYQGQEVDLVEERDGDLHGFEFKFNPKARVSLPSSWRKTYPDASFQAVTPDNYQNFVLPAPENA